MVLPLIEGLRARLIVRDEAALTLFPQIKPIDFQTAVHLALGRIQRDNVETSWSDAGHGGGRCQALSVDCGRGHVHRNTPKLLDLKPADIFRSYAGIGGERGWLYMDWAWGLRGWLDKAVGGVGLRRGRRHPDEIRRRVARFLARRGSGEGSPAASAGRDEAAGQGLAAIRVSAAGCENTLQGERVFCSVRTLALLVRAVAP